MNTKERSVEKIVEELNKTELHDDAFLVSQQELAKVIKAERQRCKEVVEAERERILSDILKWSKTATVMETTGNEGAKRATKKLRENLSGCYHFLYQAIKLTQFNNK